ncbi:MAG: type II secretion system F family protein [Candidatus Omnitrophota bacterium]
MPGYLYKARDEKGKLITGNMICVSEEDLAEKLRKMGYMPVSIKNSSGNISREGLLEFFKKIKNEDLIIFNIQMANMLDAGIPILKSLRTISSQIENKKLKAIVEKVSADVEGGTSFSEALLRHPAVFSPLFTNMVKAGEASGNLDTVLNRLAKYVEQQEEIRQQIKNALFYPSILVFAGVSVIIFIVSFVMPKFVEIFTRSNVALPVPTQILYMTGMILKNFWYLVLLGFGALVMGARVYIRTKKGKMLVDQYSLALPVIGPLVRKTIIARFTRTLSTLLESGVPILQAMDILQNVVGNSVISLVVKNARSSIENGERIAPSLQLSGEFPQDAVQMIAIGEEAGSLDHMLAKIADFYDTSVGYAIKKLTALIEPAFLVIMGAMVGFIMASMLLPIFDMVKTIHN